MWLDATAHTGDRLLHLGVANNWYLQKMVAGSPTTLASGFLEVLAPGDVRVMQLRAEGSLLTALVDGVVIYQVVDTSITAAGRPGVYEGTLGTPTVGYHTDYIQAFKTAPIVDSTANAHNGTAIGNFTLGQDGSPREEAHSPPRSPRSRATCGCRAIAPSWRAPTAPSWGWSGWMRSPTRDRRCSSEAGV